jgi:thiol-disulfide isomerase/thioredoxin
MMSSWRSTGLALIFAIGLGQWWTGRDLHYSPLPLDRLITLQGQPAPQLLRGRPTLIYIWAEWCGICRAMQNSISAIGQDYPLLTIAEHSGDDARVRAYLTQYGLQWPVVNDDQGVLGGLFGIRGVPVVLIVDAQQQLLLTSTGYSSEWGLRLRLWLARLLNAP